MTVLWARSDELQLQKTIDFKVIEVIDLAKPLVVGLINDFNNAFR